MKLCKTASSWMLPRWRRGPRMDAARCFAAAAAPPFLDNAILVVGGGDTLWVGGTASRECEILDLG